MIRPVPLQDIETVYAIYTDETVNPYMLFCAHPVIKRGTNQFPI